MVDLQLALDVVLEAQRRPYGARHRAAIKRNVARSTVTAAIQRLELALGVSLFAASGDATPSSGKATVLTASGLVFAELAPAVLRSFELLRRIVQDAAVDAHADPG